MVTSTTTPPSSDATTAKPKPNPNPNPNPKPTGLKLEHLDLIDMSTLSQSELRALSLCSAAAFDQHDSDNELIVPQINPSLFNESAGTHRQTYSRLHRRRVPPSSTTASGSRSETLPSVASASVSAENRTIVRCLKSFLGQTENSNSNLNSNEPVILDPVSVSETYPGAIVVYNSDEKKRKRGRKSRVSGLGDGNGNDVESLNVNSNGVVVDFVELGNSDSYYSEELRRSTEGLRTEDEALGFLRGLNGKWCSRRKKRKFVDASEFGDKFPVGWKILLALKRREGSVSVYCRRFVSPTGEHFLTCKEVSFYLQSYFGESADQPMDNAQQDNNVASGNGGLLDKENTRPHISLPSLSRNDQEVSLLGIENLPEVQIRDIFDCSKCKLNFDKKNDYLRHLLSVHQNTTRRYRVGTSVGDGVIIKDGKYECQFCHKGFQERRSYSSHVGVHVRSNVRKSKPLPAQVTGQKIMQSPYHDELSSRMSRMNALIEIAHNNSILENSNDELVEKTNGDSRPNILNEEEIPAANSDHDPSFDHRLNEIGNCMGDGAQVSQLERCDLEHIIIGKKITKAGDISDIGNYGVAKLGSGETDVVCGNNNLEAKKAVTDATKQISEDMFQSEVMEFSMSPVQSLHCVPASGAVLDKGEDGLPSADQELDNVLGFDEFRLDDIEPLNYSFVGRQQSVSAQEVPSELPKDAGMEDGLKPLFRFEPDTVMLNTAGSRLLTSVCVWCRNEFNHEAFDFETQSDSIGYMCPTCKAKISGHLDSFCP